MGDTSSEEKSTSTSDFKNELKEANLWGMKADDMDLAQTEKYISIANKYDLNSGWAYQDLNSVKARRNTLTHEAYKDEMLNLQVKYAEMAAEAAAKQQPYQQPASEAAEQYQSAASDTSKKQMMRRGLLSLTRFGNGGSSSGIGGLSTKLGG